MKKGLIIFLSEIQPKMFKIFNSNKSNGEESPKKHEDKLLTSNKPDSATYFLSEKSGNQTAGHGQSSQAASSSSDHHIQTILAA